jgi:hypothetical protein
LWIIGDFMHACTLMARGKVEQVHVERAEIEQYTITLKDKSRPPSKGGNSRAWHRHVMTIGGETYSFLATWSGKFVYKGETVSFDWEWDSTGSYRNVDRTSIVAWSTAGEKIVRGERGEKRWRTADNRLPARRSEWAD